MNKSKTSDPLVRIEFRAPQLIRIEEARGARGFEDRASLFSPGRAAWAPTLTRVISTPASVDLNELRVDLWREAGGTLAYRVIHRAGPTLHECLAPCPARAHLPAPSAPDRVWAIADRPRMIPPPWGACPPPVPDAAQSGWELDADARDEYIFLRDPAQHALFIATVLRLTGPIPMIPLCALGLMDSRWHPYHQKEILEVWDRFEREGIPLDITAVDTDWRQGSSTGYAINTELFPDIKAFFAEARRRGIRTLLNDHPEPQHDDILDPNELRFRYEGLTSLLEMGADYWWFDRNWPISLKEPAPGFSKEVWGMCLYHDITQRYRPERRVLIQSNADGIHNGIPESPCSLISHRYPFWWTGDTRCWWDYLEHGVRNAVNLGWQSLMPYLSEDLGGFWGTPDDELYARFVQFGVFSPICRLHASYKQYRHPWLFGEAGKIAADYLRLRYRMLPLLYTAAHNAHSSGRPLLRRCDWEWPEHAESSDPLQYLLGPDLLVAPIIEPITPYVPVPIELLHTPDGQPGLRVSFYPNRTFSGSPVCVEADTKLNHFWAKQAPRPGLEPLDYSIIWEGTLGPIPENGRYRLAIKGGMEIRLYLNGLLKLDRFGAPEKVLKWVDLELREGESIDLRIEWRTRKEWYEKCDFQLLWSRAEASAAARALWLPPGRWYNFWTGTSLQGPLRLFMSAPLSQIPLWVRGGGLFPSIPLRMRSGAAYWDTLSLDAFVGPPGAPTRRQIYEDDGEGLRFAGGAYRETIWEMESLSHGWRMRRITTHSTPHAPKQSVLIRVHGLPHEPAQVELNGVPVPWRFSTNTNRGPDPDWLARSGGLAADVLELATGVPHGDFELWVHY